MVPRPPRDSGCMLDVNGAAEVRALRMGRTWASAVPVNNGGIMSNASRTLVAFAAAAVVALTTVAGSAFAATGSARPGAITPNATAIEYAAGPNATAIEYGVTPNASMVEYAL